LAEIRLHILGVDGYKKNWNIFAAVKRNNPITAPLSLSRSGKSYFVRAASAGHQIAALGIGGNEKHDFRAFVLGNTAISGSPQKHRCFHDSVHGDYTPMTYEVKDNRFSISRPF